MTPRVACVIIAHEKRKDLALQRVLPSVLACEFDDVVFVNDWGHVGALTYKALHVAAITHTTLDALVKRDAGTLATTADIIVYLNDDHALHPAFLLDLREVINEAWDVIVPNRYTYITDHQLDRRRERIDLNNGEQHEYCGGHAGVFRRRVIQARPWTAHYHHRLWDLYSSLDQKAAGFRFLWKPRAGIAIEDLEPQNAPWR